MNFNFDQSIEDYKKRLELIEEYIEVCGDLNNKELELLGNYILYAYDKSLKRSNKLDKQHYQVLVNHNKKLKTHIRRSGFKRLSLKNPYWDNRVDEVSVNNNSKRIESNKDTLDLIDSQIDSLLNLKQRAKDGEGIGINKSRLFREINGDIAVLNQSKKTNSVLIKENGFHNHDTFKNLDIDYNNIDVMMVLIRNMKELKRIVDLNSTLYHILLDIEMAIEKCTFTDKQMHHLHLYMDGENTKIIQIESVKLAVRKIMKNL